MFTKIKDVDLRILSELNDRDLLNVCVTNKYAHKICQDEHFWRNRLVSQYGDKVFKYKFKDMNWKNYYMQIIIDLEGYDPLKFLDSIVWYPVYINQSLFKMEGKILFFGDASSVFLNNLRYLKIADITIWLKNKKYSFKNITPEDLLNFLAENIKDNDVYIRGFRKYVDENGEFGEGYTPNIIYEWQDNDMTDEE